MRERVGHGEVGRRSVGDEGVRPPAGALAVGRGTGDGVSGGWRVGRRRGRGPRPVRPGRAAVAVRPPEVPRPADRSARRVEEWRRAAGPGCWSADPSVGPVRRAVPAAPGGRGLALVALGRGGRRAGPARARRRRRGCRPGPPGSGRGGAPRPPRSSSPRSPVRRCGTSPHGSRRGCPGRGARRSPSGSWPTTHSPRCVCEPGQVLRVAAADRAQPARGRSSPDPGRHAATMADPASLPLHVVVTSVLLAQRLGLTRWRSSRKGSRRALPVLPARRQPGHRLPRGGRRPGHPAQAILRRLRPAVHHRRGGGARGGEAQRGHRAVQPRQGRARRPACVSGPPGRRRRARAARAPGGGGRPRRRRRRDPQPRGRAGHPRPPARAGRGRLHAFRQRLPLVLLDRGLREGDRRPAPGGRAVARRRRRPADRPTVTAPRPHRPSPPPAPSSGQPFPHTYADRGPSPQGGAAGEGEHDRDRRAPATAPGRGRKAGRAASAVRGRG